MRFPRGRSRERKPRRCRRVAARRPRDIHRRNGLAPTTATFARPPNVPRHQRKSATSKGTERNRGSR
ncbi:unnamed protein product, partial [Iphiclides podalirius]